MNLSSSVSHHQLEEGLHDVCSTLPIEAKVHRLPYVYNRHATLKCSRRCLQIDFQVLIPENLPSSNEVDIRPFLYSNVDLLKMEDAESTPALREPQQTGKYAWAVDPSYPWAWNEAVWSTRLLHCIQEAEVFRDVEVMKKQ